MFYFCRFRIDNTDHIVDVNKGLKSNIGEYDQVNIVCPYYPNKPRGVIPEKFIIYLVNKEEFDSCRIMTPHPRVIAKCDTPQKPRFYTLSFRSFSPTPGAMEFHPGKDYYFISTSSKTDIHQRVDGMCRDFNMKLLFKVFDPNSVPSSTEQPDVQSSTLNPVVSPSTFISLFDDSLNEGKILDGGSLANEITVGLSDKRQKLSDIDFILGREEEDKNLTKKKRRKHRKKHRNRGKKKSNLMEDTEGVLGGSPGRNRRLKKKKNEDILNDNPSESDPGMTEEEEAGRSSLGGHDNEDRRVIEKELSLVEKVNNLMKQEASIGASSSSSVIAVGKNGLRGCWRFAASILLLLLLSS